MKIYNIQIEHLPCLFYQEREKPYKGKSLSEALIFASTNPQYENIFFIELQAQYMKIPSSEHGENML